VILDEDGEEEGSEHPEEQSHGRDKGKKDELLDTVDISLASQRSEDSTFIPLGWTRKCEVKPYKGSDPEWQEFLKFAYDVDRGVRVRRM
jgi:hypothetical protein